MQISIVAHKHCPRYVVNHAITTRGPVAAISGDRSFASWEQVLRINIPWTPPPAIWSASLLQPFVEQSVHHSSHKQHTNGTHSIGVAPIMAFLCTKQPRVPMRFRYGMRPLDAHSASYHRFHGIGGVAKTTRASIANLVLGLQKFQVRTRSAPSLSAQTAIYGRR
ncbi:hypothetical protein PAXINDRAFT_9117 [Paxillus involutus ATCC 200175]|nr:hypothetical protein PAXINDRAFT_9117 [Paxillus involutus ATCC 200175]